MRVAEHPCNLPSCLLMSPHNYEIGASIALAGRELAELMTALLDGTKVLDRVNLESAGDEFAAEMAAHVISGIGDHRLASPGDTTLVVIELDVRCKEAGMLLKLLRCAAFVERVEYGRIERSYRVEQRVRSRRSDSLISCGEDCLRCWWRDSQKDSDQEGEFCHAGFW